MHFSQHTKGVGTLLSLYALVVVAPYFTDLYLVVYTPKGTAANKNINGLKVGVLYNDIIQQYDVADIKRPDTLSS